MHQCYGRHIVQPETGLVGIPSIIFSKHVPNKSLRILVIAIYYVTFNISCDGALYRQSIHIFSFKLFYRYRPKLNSPGSFMSMNLRSSIGTGTGQRGGPQKFDSRQRRKVLCSPSPGRFCGSHSLLSCTRLGSFLDTEVKGM